MKYFFFTLSLAILLFIIILGDKSLNSISPEIIETDVAHLEIETYVKDIMKMHQLATYENRAILLKEEATDYQINQFLQLSTELEDGESDYLGYVIEVFWTKSQSQLDLQKQLWLKRGYPSFIKQKGDSYQLYLGPYSSYQLAKSIQKNILLLQEIAVIKGVEKQ